MPLRDRTIALIEDDLIMGESLMERLTLEGAKVQWWRNCQAAIQNLTAFAPDIVVCDIRLPDGTGEEVFKDASAAPQCPPFLFMTGHGDIEQAVRLMRNGAGDYITKPFETGRFVARIAQLLRPAEQSETPRLGVSGQMLDIQRLLQRVARVSAPVLLTGETGVGKEVCAKYLHGLLEVGTPFVAVNCAAIPKDLLESEIFGHEKGAFTGAASRHLGYAERARNGILFLDEIGELDTKLQAKLLRLLEAKSFYRVGGETELSFRARLVCATNADLSARVRDGSFREDLFYRINVLTVAIPPLRERPDDSEWLAEGFTEALAIEAGAALAGLSGLSISAIRSHNWPGNVRELRNRIERAVSLAPGPWIMPGDLFPERPSGAGHVDPKSTSLEAVRDEAERHEILRALRQSGGAVIEAAGLLGISRTTMWAKMRRHRIEGLPPLPLS